MERERELDDKDICAQAMVAIIFSFFLSVRARKLFQAKASFGIASCKWEVYSAAFSAGVITGWLGFTKEKNGSRTEGCDDVVTRLDPIATHMAVESRVVVVLSLVRIVSSLLRS